MRLWMVVLLIKALLYAPAPQSTKRASTSFCLSRFAPSNSVRMTSKRIAKVVFPVAGLGTRFLPASKVIAKEMLPLVNKPLIQYAVEEAVEAGADTLVFVINRNKRQIADHFDAAFELEHQLEKSGKHELLAAAQSVLPKGVQTVFVTQRQALGLGHAILCAESVVGAETFGIILPDDFIYHPKQGALSQLVQAQAEQGGSVVAVEDVPRQKTASYGIVSAENPSQRCSIMRGIVEKPQPEHAPSTLGVTGRYVLDSRIFALLRHVKPGAGGEIQLTDGIAALLQEQPVHAFRFAGQRFDCGTKLGFVQATVRLALDDPDFGAEFKATLQKLID
jgi:UTP--glucose-1-phosphate uridylyltransferase